MKAPFHALPALAMIAACGSSISSTTSSGTNASGTATTTSTTGSSGTTSGATTAATTSGSGVASGTTSGAAAASGTTSSSGGDFSGDDAGLSGQLAFPIAFEGVTNGVELDGVTPVASDLQVVMSTYDTSGYCAYTPETPIPLPPFPQGTEFLYIHLDSDAGTPLAPGVYAISGPNALLGTAEVMVRVKHVTRDAGPELLVGESYDGNITLTAMSGTLAAGTFQVDMQDALGNGMGALSGSFGINPCEGIIEWSN